MKRKVNCAELSVEITLLGLAHMVMVTSETWPDPLALFNKIPAERLTSCFGMTLSSNSKD